MFITFATCLVEYLQTREPLVLHDHQHLQLGEQATSRRHGMWYISIWRGILDMIKKNRLWFDAINKIKLRA